MSQLNKQLVSRLATKHGVDYDKTMLIVTDLLDAISEDISALAKAMSKASPDLGCATRTLAARLSFSSTGIKYNNNE